jgi:hypothetical protein
MSPKTTHPHMVVDTFFDGAIHLVRNFQIHHTDGECRIYRKRSIRESLFPIDSRPRASRLLGEEIAQLFDARIAPEIDDSKGISK